MKLPLITSCFLVAMGLLFQEASAQSYSFRRPLKNQFQRLKSDDGKWGIAHYRKRDSVFVEPTYSFVFPNAVWGKYVVVNQGGKKSPYASTVVEGGKYGVITPLGEEVLPITYDWIDRAVIVRGGKAKTGITEGSFVLWSAGSWGIMGEDGAPIDLKHTYSFIHAALIQDEKGSKSYFFYANRGGTLSNTNGGWYIVKGGSFVILNSKGEEIHPFSCDYMKAAPKGATYLYKGSKSGEYSLDEGRIIWK